MGIPQWWSRRRFGVLIDVSLATVPAWAPVGQDAAWYRAHIDPDTRDLQLHPGGLVEALDHHRRRWAHIEHYDDFGPFLHFDDFDPDAWAGLARDAGVGYAIMTAKHHDGLCWWDAPATDRTVLHDGPRRNVLGEFAAACRTADLIFGTSYSLLDWADPRYPGAAYVTEVLHPQVLDLVERYGSRLLWGDAQWGAGGDHWRSAELLGAARAIAPDLVVNDRWWAEADVVTREFRLPDGIVDEPWEFRRPLGSSAGYNRAEPSDRLLSAKQIVALLTEVVAKGGHLLLQIGADATGAIPTDLADPLRAAGGWIRRHRDLIDRGLPWTVWGDADSRLLRVDGQLFAVDVSGHGRFAPLDFERGKVTTIETTDGRSVTFDQTDHGVQLVRPPRKAQRLPAVYRIELEPPPPAPIELFPAATAPSVTELAPLVADARSGAIIQLGDGTYVGPARVPSGVTLRGLGPDRTTIDGDGGVALVLEAGSRLEHCRVAGGGRRIGRLPQLVVDVAGDGATVLGCDVRGHVAVHGSNGRVTSCTAYGVLASDVDHLEVCRSTLTGIGTDTGVDVRGGAGHLVDGCEITGHLASVSLTGTVGAAVRHSCLDGRWWGVRLVDTEASEVIGNAFERTMRAVDVDGGTGALVTGNAASDGDSGCVIQGGAASSEVSGNYWERCRVGLLAWGAGEFRSRANTGTDLGDEGDLVVVGP